jgi:dienelactone hydrolase
MNSKTLHGDGSIGSSRFSNPAWRMLFAAFVAALVIGASFPARAQGPRALQEGQALNDRRLQPLKDLDGYFPFSPPRTAAEWDARAERLRRQLLVSLGLWPMPTKTALNAVIHGKIDRQDHTIEKVYFESAPGFFVTGNLYRPKGKNGKLPAVLSAHGHWESGRFHDKGLQRVRQEIAQGAERFEEGGRSPLQARCVQLARMGCVVFHYDMIGYADAGQIPMSVAHSFARQRPEMNRPQNWGLYSPQAEAHLQSVMGLQTWNSIRALDFLLALPDVDQSRVAVTGASGGGTQTFILCALDSRPAVSFPAVMVSTAMQGGCTCENASLLRVGTGNVEFAALFAPKPLGLTAADDWTREMAGKGFPELRELYSMLGAPNNVALTSLLQFGHNYNYVSRASMYHWVNQHLKLELPEPIVEEDYKRLGMEEMSVWNDQHPQPEGGADFERKLLRWLHDDSENQIRQSRGALEQFREITAGGVDVVIGRNIETAGQVEWQQTAQRDHGSYTESAGLLRNSTYTEELPAVLLQPKTRNGQTVIWISDSGKAALFRDGQPRDAIRKLLDAGVLVVGLDLLFQGEFVQDGQPVTRTRRVQNPREAAAYTFGYNHALFAQRVHDILSAMNYIRLREPSPGTIDLVCLDAAGPIAAAARAQSGSVITRAAINTTGFRFGNVSDIHDANFLPGGAKYGDLPGMLALGAPGKLWLAGEEGAVPELVNDIYTLAGAAGRIVIAPGEPRQLDQSAAAWLITDALRQ